MHQRFLPVYPSQFNAITSFNVFVKVGNMYDVIRRNPHVTAAYSRYVDLLFPALALYNIYLVGHDTVYQIM